MTRPRENCSPLLHFNPNIPLYTFEFFVPRLKVLYVARASFSFCQQSRVKVLRFTHLRNSNHQPNRDLRRLQGQVTDVFRRLRRTISCNSSCFKPSSRALTLMSCRASPKADWLNVGATATRLPTSAHRLSYVQPWRALLPLRVYFTRAHTIIPQFHCIDPLVSTTEDHIRYQASPPVLSMNPTIAAMSCHPYMIPRHISIGTYEQLRQEPRSPSQH